MASLITDFGSAEWGHVFSLGGGVVQWLTCWLRSMTLLYVSPVTTLTGDCLRTGEPSWCVTSRLSHLGLPSLGVGKSSTGLSGWD